jgi:prepilin-type N-terminal cleavage/methylation domain-containing protein
MDLPSTAFPLKPSSLSVKGSRPSGAISSGFTLLEILIAIVIVATVLSTVFASYTTTFRVIRQTESQVEIYQMARTVLDRVVEDLESVYIPKDVEADAEKPETEKKEETGSYVFEGEDTEINGVSANTLRFPSKAHVVFAEEDQSWGTAQITYYVEEAKASPGLVLLRSDRLVLEEPLEERKGGYPLCEGLAAVKFGYIDDKGEEHSSWDPSEKDRIPQMVTLTLDFLNPSDPERSFRFFTTVGLPTSEPADEPD